MKTRRSIIDPTIVLPEPEISDDNDTVPDLAYSLKWENGQYQLRYTDAGMIRDEIKRLEICIKRYELEKQRRSIIRRSMTQVIR